MIINPFLYIEEMKDWSLDKLYEEKDHLEECINKYKQREIKEEEDFRKISSNDMASIYEKYLARLNNLIENKERENKTDKKYIELDKYKEIEKFLKENNFFEGAEIYKISNKNGNAEIFIEYGDKDIEFYFYEVSEFNMSYYTDEIYIDSVYINNMNGKTSLEINGDTIYIFAQDIRVRTLDIDNTIYTYVSVKFKENQSKTFYYISNIENLKIGDYVYVPVRETSCPAIIENIEKFSCANVPFPLNMTKTIIRKSSKYEFEDYNGRNINIFKEDEYNYDYVECEFEFKDYNTIKERVRKLPFVRSQKVEWEDVKVHDDGSLSMPFPKYDKKVKDWIQAFHKLELLDHNHVKNFYYIKEKNIEELNFNEILSYLTHIIRGERFCDGLIASNLGNGNIELLEKRLFAYILNFIELDDNNIKEFDEKDIMFFTLAESGAMGEPNGIEIVTKKGNNIKLYHTNISVFDVRKLYSKFTDLETLNCASFGIITGLKSDFKHVDMEMGNHLFISEAINDKFQEAIKNLKPSEIYNRWIIIGLDLLDFDWDRRE